MVMNFRDRDIAESLWTLGERTQVRRLQPDEDGSLEGLARYIAKPETKEGNRKGAKTYATSINLEKPSVTRSDHRLPKTGYRLSKKRVTEIVMDENKRIAILEEHYKGFKVVELPPPKFSDYSTGAYMYVKLVKNPSGARKRP